MADKFNAEALRKLFNVAEHENEVRRMVDLLGADRVISIALKHVESKRERAAKEFESAAARAKAAYAAAPRCMGMDCCCGGDCPDLRIGAASPPALNQEGGSNGIS